MSVLDKLKAVHRAWSQRLNTLLPPGVSWATKWHSFRFSGKRSDYYLYLADLIESTEGQLNFKQIFMNDVMRYKGKARGHLSAHWYKQFDLSGGDLKRTFRGTMPQEDVELLDALQNLGGINAMQGGFADLAHNNGVVDSARTQLLATSFSSLMAVLVVVVMLLVMPPFTVPTIKESFSFLPEDKYPESAQSLFAFAAFIESYWLIIAGFTAAVIILCYWSFSNLTGSTRVLFDKYGFAWSMYRDFQSMRFITSLGSMTKKRGNFTMGLQQAIELQLRGGSRWKRYHIKKMLAMVRSGNVSSDIFSTGLMDSETYYYLDDLIRSRGFDDALQYVRARIEVRVLKRIKVQSTILSWSLMFVAIAVAAYLMIWHFQVMEDLRTTIQMVVN